jgi:glucuronate isomerase
MLYSQGIALESLGVPRANGKIADYDPREAWQLFAENYYLFRGTPTGMWLNDKFANVFGVTDKLTGENAQEIYDHIDAKLKLPKFTPRQLYEEFNIEVLASTDAATNTLDNHQKIQESGWGGRILPTFRPDALANLNNPCWRSSIQELEEVSGMAIVDYDSFITALESQRAFFKSMGATSTDHAALTALTLELTHYEADAISQKALRGDVSEEEIVRFNAGILLDMARMSVEDGLVMQLHVGSFRNHYPAVFRRFGLDKGADIPITIEFTKNLKPLLDCFGNDPHLTLILFNLDESTYSRELVPLAGHYPAIKLGPPWWFHDSLNGIRSYFELVMETAGVYNTVGFNDDTRAFSSIPARHDLWQRAACDWGAGLLVRHVVDESDAHQITEALSYSLAKNAYKL